MRATIRKSMTRLGLGGIARRLLDEKRKTEDVTPPPHIAPCGMQVPANLAMSKTPVISPPGQRLAAATKKRNQPPHTAPCGMQVPAEVAESKTPVISPVGPSFEAPIKRGKPPRMEKQKLSRKKPKKIDPRGEKSAAKPTPFGKFFKKR